MAFPTTYDTAIIGGGLAGLALSIQLADAGFSVILFEKEKYPYHKVCGEYISMESWPFLERLGLPLQELSLPRIDTLRLTAPGGNVFTAKLPLGGFGISRYLLDERLCRLARAKGVTVLEETKVENVIPEGEAFGIKCSGKREVFRARTCCGAYGKRGNLDVKWKRPFLTRSNPRLNNFIAVKYHIRTDWPDHVIGLHNFENGYCGISRIEEGKYCLCYLTTAANLRRSGNSIPEMQEGILSRNGALRRIFRDSEVLPSFPVTISQVSFSSKSQVEGGVLLLGDSAGMITPLCGNGMSMALHSSKLAFGSLLPFLQGRSTRAILEETYRQQWRQQFARRMQTGRALQYFFGKEAVSDLFVGSFRLFPFLAQPVIRMTHGEPF